MCLERRLADIIGKSFIDYVIQPTVRLNIYKHISAAFSDNS